MKEFIILTAEDCGGCKIIKKHIQNPSNVEILDITKSDEAALIAAKNNILSVPTVLKKTSEGGIEKCDLTLQDGKVKAKCGNEETIL